MGRGEQTARKVTHAGARAKTGVKSGVDRGRDSAGLDDTTRYSWFKLSALMRAPTPRDPRLSSPDK